MRTVRCPGVFGTFPSFQIGRHQACIGPNAQAFAVTGLAAGQRDEALAIPFGKGPPPTRQARFIGDDPDLEDLGRRGFQVALAVGDPGAGAHDLHIAGLGAAFVAEVESVWLMAPSRT